MKRNFVPIVAEKYWLIVLVLVSIQVTALACKVPVFRYALERWPVDKYGMVLILDGSPSEEIAAAIRRIQNVSAEGKANIQLEVIDLSSLSPQQQWQLDDFDPSVETPHLQVFYPERSGRKKLCWEGRFTTSSLDRWLVSPLRSQVADSLVGGASAVFVIVECEDVNLNRQIESVVNRGVQQAMAEIQIPEGVIPRLGANEYLEQNPEASLDDVLRCDVPLKVDFKVSRLAFDDQNESALRAMGGGLANSSSGPWVLPIFGRGRMLDAIDAEHLTVQTVLNACKYMVGECSCTVKTQNPGVDLLMSANWSESLGVEPVVMVDSILDRTPQFVEIPVGTESHETSDQSERVDGDRKSVTNEGAKKEDQENERTTVTDDGDSSGFRWEFALVFLLAGIGIFGLRWRLRSH